MRISNALDGVDSVNKLWKLISFEQLRPNFSLSFGNMDSTYSITLRAALNISWHQDITNKEFWYNRLRFVRPCFHSKQELVVDLLLWQFFQNKTVKWKTSRKLKAVDTTRLYINIALI